MAEEANGGVVWWS